MKTLDVKEFICIYQYAIFNQVRAIFGSLQPDEDFGQTVVRFNTSLSKYSRNSSVICFMLDSSNLGKVIQVLGNFTFLRNSFDAYGFAFFGRDNSYNFDIGIEIVTGKVVLFDNEQNTFAYIAKDEFQFLNYLKIYLEYTILTTNVGNLNELTSLVREKLMKEIEEDEYKQYYTFIFPDASVKDYGVLRLPYKI